MDQICYIMIEHLSELYREVLLKFYNKIWEGGKLPQNWKEAVIVPIPKPWERLHKSNICRIIEKNG